MFYQRIDILSSLPNHHISHNIHQIYFFSYFICPVTPSCPHQTWSLTLQLSTSIWDLSSFTPKYILKQEVFFFKHMRCHLTNIVLLQGRLVLLFARLIFSFQNFYILSYIYKSISFLLQLCFITLDPLYHTKSVYSTFIICALSNHICQSLSWSIPLFKKICSFLIKFSSHTRFEKCTSLQCIPHYP